MLAIARGRYVSVGVISGRPLYGIEGWPRNRGFVSTISIMTRSGTKVSVLYRRSGRLIGVVVKRGSTVACASFIDYIAQEQ